MSLSPVYLYTQEPDTNKATLAKVIPTPNNGSAELVALQRDQVSSHIYSQDAPSCLNWERVPDLTFLADHLFDIHSGLDILLQF